MARKLIHRDKVCIMIIAHPSPASTVTTPIIICPATPDSSHTAIDLHPVLILTSIYSLYTYAHIRLLLHLIVDIHLGNLCLQRIHVLKVADHWFSLNSDGACPKSTFPATGQVRFDNSAGLDVKIPI
jgi:hypothetical protein